MVERRSVGNGGARVSIQGLRPYLLCGPWNGKTELPDPSQSRLILAPERVGAYDIGDG
jgi:hypothetical protein